MAARITFVALTALVVFCAFQSAAATPSPNRSLSPKLPNGLIVVAVGKGNIKAAKTLARQLYADPSLRPPIDETTARLLVGQPPPANNTSLQELAEVVANLETVCKADCGQSTVARRLLASLGDECHAKLVIVVEGVKQPVAKVMRTATGQFDAIVFSAKVKGNLASWPDAKRIVRFILHKHVKAKPRKRRSKPRAGPINPKAKKAAKSGDDLKIFSSPWFWGGVGVVAAVGISVFAVSQAESDDPDTVFLKGRVSP